MIEHDDIRVEIADEAQRFRPVRRDADRDEVVARRDGAAKPFAHHRVVVGDDEADPSLRGRRARRNVARAALTLDRAVDIGAISEAQLGEDRADRYAFALTETLLGESALELRRLDHTGVDEEQPETGIGRGLIENEPQHPNEIERPERLHDVGGRADGARERTALRIVARGQHDHASIPRSP